MAELTL
jgi:hypothetical protein